MSEFRKMMSKSTRTAKFGMVVIVLWVLCAIFAPMIAPYGENDVDITKRMVPPAWSEKGTAEHLLGTDEMGRDILSRIIYGSRVSLIVGVMAVLVSFAIGTTLGLIAGYFGGLADSIIMRSVDVMLSFPFIFLALCLMAVLGSSLINVIIVLGITGWVDYYTKYISERPDWELIEVYTDEGISAVSTKRRDGFKRMIADALAGRIDLIVTKSVSRFARNTVDSLQTIRQLKEKGVECYFEKENIWTFDGKGELLITIMSSLAQEESRSLSQNVTWGHRKRFADGKVSMPYKRFLGYERGKDGRPRIVESEAKIVRHIYQLYLNGTTVRDICKALTDAGIPTPGGKEKWPVSTVMSILENEKYAGNALLQKKYCEDFLTKKMVKNEGQVPQYFVTESHPAIISQEVYDLVQSEIAKNRALGKARSGCFPFSDIIICGTCGHTYGRKVWSATTKYRRVVWQCNGKYIKPGEPACRTPHLSEEQIGWVFSEALNRILSDRERYIAALEPALELIGDTAELDSEAEILQERNTGLYAQLKELVTAQAHCSDNLAEYQASYIELSSRYEEVKHRLAEIEQELQARKVKRGKALAFIEILRGRETLLTEFDEQLWRATVEKIIVHSERDVAVHFRDGRSVSVNLLAMPR